MEVVDLKKYQESVEIAFHKGADIECLNRYTEDTPKEWTICSTPVFDWDVFNYRVKIPTAMNEITESKKSLNKAIGVVETMLSEREKTHGNFRDHARCTQRLKAVLRDELEIMGRTLTMEQQEALDMVFHKIGRMVAGDANFIDHWDDLAGYSTLVAKILRGEL